MTKQTEAQRLASELYSGTYLLYVERDATAALLLRQDELLAQALEALWTTATPKGEAVIAEIRKHLEAK